MFNIFSFFTGRHKKKRNFELENFLLNTNFSTDVIEELRQYFNLNKKDFIKKLKSLLKMQDYIPTEPTKKPFVILVLGVNGVGKTTSSAKLAYYYKSKGYSVKLVGADTFRAGAREQLANWAKRLNVGYFSDNNVRDPSAIAYTAIELAKNDDTDIVIIDTGGRLHNKLNLMAEIKKLIKVVEKLLLRPVDQKVLVLDATQGQTVKSQLKHFMEFTDFDGVLLSKFDSLSNIGTIFALDNIGTQILFLGTGERPEDLEFFTRDYIFESFE